MGKGGRGCVPLFLSQMTPPVLSTSIQIHGEYGVVYHVHSQGLLHHILIGCGVRERGGENQISPTRMCLCVLISRMCQKALGASLDCQVC